MRKASKPIIGFLAARLEEPYQHAVWTGAMEEAERLSFEEELAQNPLLARLIEAERAFNERIRKTLAEPVEAIEAGATHVRVGSALFGERNMVPATS